MADEAKPAAAADPWTAWWLGVLPAVLGAGPAPAPAAGHVPKEGAEPDYQALMPGLAGAALASMARALGPLSINLERAYGGLADAFGLAPLRELQSASRDLSLALLEQRRAQAEYLTLISGAAAQGQQTLTTRLAEMGARGESVSTLLALSRLWASAMDEALHTAMQSPPALQASADVIRASTRSRQQQQRLVAIASEALNVPTRAEVDDAYREIQQLKRELRRLRKRVEATASPPALPPPQQRQPPPEAPPQLNGAAAP